MNRAETRWTDRTHRPMKPLISAEELSALLPRAVLLDCGFDLADTTLGEREFAVGHLPGAQYAHLDRDLSGPKAPGLGRHPLPDRTELAATLGRWGIAPGTPVVAYDAQGGPYAARAWWLLRWLGHTEVAVLDGGRAAWVAAGGALEAGAAEPLTVAPPYPAAATAAMPTAEADALLAPGGPLVVDARAPERYRGEVEPLDPVAGHIPGALNRVFKLNLAADGRFKPAAMLRVEFESLLGGRPAAQVVQQCGSGVTACHNLLAMEAAGLGTSALYPPSWSGWIDDPAHPVARG
jgi:thiosulfate/3-mercaptopyruvate sulfurtransferase